MYSESDSLRRRGQTQRAIALADQGLERWENQPASEWHWRFRLLKAELWLIQNSPRHAAELLESGGIPPSDELTARYLADLGQAKNDPRLVERAFELATRQNLAAVIPAIELKRAYLDGYSARSGQFLRHALAKAKEQSDLYMQAAALLDLGRQRVLWSRFDEAIPYAEQARDIARAAGASRLQDRALGNIGFCYYRLGDLDRALQALTEATNMSRQVSDHEMVVTHLNDIGNIYYRRKEFRPAISFYKEAADLAARMNYSQVRIMALNNLAATSLEAGDLSAAESYNTQSADLLAKSPNRESLLHSQLHSAGIAAAQGRTAEADAAYRAVIASAKKQREPLVLWEAEAALAHRLHAAGQDAEADTAYRDALSTIEKEWANLGEDRHKVTFLAQLIRFYGDYVDFLMAANQPDRAATIADSSRARVLAEELGHEPGVASELPPAASGAVVLSYWLAPGRSYLWMIGPNGAKPYTLPGEERIAALVKQYSAAIERGHDPIELDNPAGQALFDTLIGPARSAIPRGANVIVVPDGCLHGLNFETLIVDDPAPHYWIEDVTVAVAPAVGLLEPALIPRADSRKLLFIGDPALDDPDYPPLPHLKLESEIVKRNFPSVRAFTRESANPRAYASAAPGDYSIIHFAAHAVANAESPLNSAILLSKADGEYKLYAEDVLHHPLQARLVTISACRSAGAKSYAGEGLVGFTWAFMQAGTRNVIAGLWNADDEATAGLMGELYHRLAAGATPAQALRDAKLKLVRSKGKNHRPYYWGPFQVFTREVSPQTKS